MPTPSVSSGPAAGGILVAAAALVVLTASAASAHPSWDPSEVQTGGAVAVDLVVPHACAADGGEPADGDEVSPITEVAMQLSDTFTIDPQPIDGWGVLVEDGVAAWLADGPGSDGDLVLPAIIEVDGEVGHVLPIVVYEECANGEFFRWAAADGEDGDPAVELTIVEGTPPPPPIPTSAPTGNASSEPVDAATEPVTPTESTAESEPTPTETVSSVSPTPSTSPAASTTPSESTEAAADDAADDGSTPIWLFVLIGLAAAGAVVYARRRGSGSTAGPMDGDGAGLS